MNLEKYYDTRSLRLLVRAQTYDSIKWGYFCIWFIKFILDNKTMTDFIRLYPFSPDKFKENEKKVLKYCQKSWDWKICVRVITSIP